MHIWTDLVKPGSLLCVLINVIEYCPYIIWSDFFRNCCLRQQTACCDCWAQSFIMVVCAFTRSNKIGFVTLKQFCKRTACFSNFDHIRTWRKAFELLKCATDRHYRVFTWRLKFCSFPLHNGDRRMFYVQMDRRAPRPVLCLVRRLHDKLCKRQL